MVYNFISHFFQVAETTSDMNAVLEKVTSKLAKPNVCCVIDGGLIMLKNCIQNKRSISSHVTSKQVAVASHTTNGHEHDWKR